MFNILCTLTNNCHNTNLSSYLFCIIIFYDISDKRTNVKVLVFELKTNGIQLIWKSLDAYISLIIKLVKLSYFKINPVIDSKYKMILPLI